MSEEAYIRKVIICRGLPNSGKSTFAEAWVAESPATRTRINRDGIRIGYFNSYWGTSVNEPGVSEIEQAIARVIMREGKRDIIVDNTGTKAESILPYMAMAMEYKYTVEFMDFLVPLEELLRRDAARDRHVGAEVITKMYNTFITAGHFESPEDLYGFTGR